MTSKARYLSVSKDVKTPKVSVKTDKKARQAALAALIKGVQATSNRIESYLPALLDKAIEAKAWDWPRPTMRKSGGKAGTTRNIVDTGKLKSSLKISTKFLKTKTTFIVAYTAPYANLVHEGGYIAPYGRMDLRSSYIPGRPWVKAVLEGGVNGIESISIADEFLAGIEQAW